MNFLATKFFSVFDLLSRAVRKNLRVEEMVSEENLEFSSVSSCPERWAKLFLQGENGSEITRLKRGLTSEITRL